MYIKYPFGFIEAHAIVKRYVTYTIITTDHTLPYYYIHIRMSSIYYLLKT